MAERRWRQDGSCAVSGLS
jgi:hypothetical protein